MNLGNDLYDMRNKQISVVLLKLGMTTHELRDQLDNKATA